MLHGALKAHFPLFRAQQVWVIAMEHRYTAACAYVVGVRISISISKIICLFIFIFIFVIYLYLYSYLYLQHDKC